MLHGSRGPAGRGNHVGCRPGVDQSPDQAEARPRVEPARQCRRKLGDEGAESEREVLGEVRPGRVSTAAVEVYVEQVGSAGERAHPEPDLAHVEARVAVQAERAAHAGERTEVDHAERAAGHDLLGRLEEQPHPAREQSPLVDLRQRQPGPQQGGGVDVVPAGVRNPRRHAGPRVLGAVVDGQRVEVGTQRHERPRGTDVGDQTRPWEAGHRKARFLEPGGHEVGGADLVPGQLGVGMQVAPKGDEVFVVLLDNCLDYAGHVTGVGGLAGDGHQGSRVCQRSQTADFTRRRRR